MEKRRIKVIATRHQRAREGINLSNKKKVSYGSNIKNEINPDQVNNEYLLLFWETMRGKL